MICGIYCIKNLITNKSYIGQSYDIEKRWKHHIIDLNSGKSHNKHLQRSWKKYGKDNFVFSVIEECEESLLNMKEIYWIEKLGTFKSGYNLNQGGCGNRGYKVSKEACIAISKRLKGKSHSPLHIKNNRLAQLNWHKNNLSKSSKKIVGLNTLEVFYNAVIAGKKYNIDSGNIRRCVNKELFHAGKFNGMKLVWIDYHEYLNLNSKDVEVLLDKPCHIKSRFIPVKCLTTGEIFESIKLASESTNTNYNSIIACCEKNRKHANKMEWEYLNNI